MAATWNIEALKEHYDEKLKDMERHFDRVLIEKDKAVLIQEQNAKLWREQANEWRATVNDLMATRLPRGEFDAYKESNDRIITAERSRSDKGEGNKGGVKDLWGYIIGAIGIIAFLVEYFKNK